MISSEVHRRGAIDPFALTEAPRARELAPHPLTGISFAERRELRGILRECNKRRSIHLSSLCEAISAKPVRDVVLSMLCEREYLLWRPSHRGQLLESLIPFANEGRVQAYAMLSLREPAYARSYSICAPAARIIHATISDPPKPITDELLDLAQRYGREKRDAAAKIAFMLLKDAPLSDRCASTALHQARLWFAAGHMKENPWLDLLIHHRHPHGLSLTSAILTGNMRDPNSHPVLFGIATLPFLPHEIAFVSSIIALAAREICRALGQNNRMANSTAVILAASCIIGGRVMWHAARLDRLNNGRDRECVEALSHLSKILAERPAEQTREESAFFKVIERQLQDTATGFLQTPAVKRAAKAALEGISDRHELLRIAQEAQTDAPLIDDPLVVPAGAS